jgi:hypothetical protein
LAAGELAPGLDAPRLRISFNVLSNVAGQQFQVTVSTGNPSTLLSSTTVTVS